MELKQYIADINQQYQTEKDSIGWLSGNGVKRQDCTFVAFPSNC